MSRTESDAPHPIPLKTRLLARLIKSVVRLLCLTLRWQIEGEAESQAILEAHHGGILVTWHGRTLLPFNWYRNRGYVALVSLSRDGELQAEHTRCFGFRVIRGSTGRRGVAATREMLALLADGGIATLTPDGPRGPRQKVQSGVVYFAQRTGKPIIPVGSSAHPNWQLSTWDCFLVPRPFSRAILLIGEPIFVAPDDDLDAAAVRVETAINTLQTRAGG